MWTMMDPPEKLALVNQPIIPDKKMQTAKNDSSAEKISFDERTGRATICFRTSATHDLVIVSEPIMPDGKGLSAQHFFIRDNRPSDRPDVKIFIPPSMKAIPMTNHAPDSCVVLPDVNVKVEEDVKDLHREKDEEECETQIIETLHEGDSNNTNGSRNDSGNIGPLVWSDRESTNSASGPRISSLRTTIRSPSRSNREDVYQPSATQIPQRSSNPKWRTVSPDVFKKPSEGKSRNYFRETKLQCQQLLERLDRPSFSHKHRSSLGRQRDFPPSPVSSRAGSPWSHVSDRLSSQSPLLDGINFYSKVGSGSSKNDYPARRVNLERSDTGPIFAWAPMDMFALSLSQMTKKLSRRNRTLVKQNIRETMIEMELENRLKRSDSQCSSVSIL